MGALARALPGSVRLAGGGTEEGEAGRRSLLSPETPGAKVSWPKAPLVLLLAPPQERCGLFAATLMIVHSK